MARPPPTWFLRVGGGGGGVVPTLHRLFRNRHYLRNTSQPDGIHLPKTDKFLVDFADYNDNADLEVSGALLRISQTTHFPEYQAVVPVSTPKWVGSCHELHSHANPPAVGCAA